MCTYSEAVWFEAVTVNDRYNLTAISDVQKILSRVSTVCQLVCQLVCSSKIETSDTHHSLGSSLLPHRCAKLRALLRLCILSPADLCLPLLEAISNVLLPLGSRDHDGLFTAGAVPTIPHVITSCKVFISRCFIPQSA